MTFLPPFHTRRSLLQATAATCVLAATGVRANQEWPKPATLASDLPASGRIKYVPPGQSNLPFPRVMVTQVGAVLDGVDFSGCYVSLHASDIKVRNCLFTTTAGIPVALDAYDGATNITIETCRFDGEKKDIHAEPMLRVRNGTLFARGCLFENLPSDGVTMVGGAIEYCTFRGSGYLTGAHADAIWVPRTIAPVVIRNNDIDWRKPADAKVVPNNAFRIVCELGDIEDVLIANNKCLGGSYTIQAGTHPKATTKFKIRNIVIRDNELADWLYGPLYPLYKPLDLIFAGNRSLVTGAFLSGAPQKAR
jgi:serralysin